MDVLQRQDLSFGACILSLTGRVAGCRGPRLSCNAVAEAWFFRSWAVVLRSYRLTRARDCRSTRSTPSGPCSELLAMSPLPLTPSFTRAIGSTLNVVVVGDNRIGMVRCSTHERTGPPGHRETRSPWHRCPERSVAVLPRNSRPPDPPEDHPSLVRWRCAGPRSGTVGITPPRNAPPRSARRGRGPARDPRPSASPARSRASSRRPSTV